MESEYKDAVLLRNFNVDFFNKEQIYNAKFASHYLNCSKNTLIDLLKSNKINGVYVNGYWLIRKSELNKFKGALNGK